MGKEQDMEIPEPPANLPGGYGPFPPGVGDLMLSTGMVGTARLAGSLLRGVLSSDRLAGSICRG